MRRWALVSLAGAACTVACGLDTAGLAPDWDAGSWSGSGSDDGSSDASGDASGSGGGEGSASSSGSASDGGSGSSSGGDGGNPAPCTITNGWTLVLGVAGGGGCPGGYPEAYMGVSNPQAGAGACTCSCNITQQPSCTTGNVTWTYGNQSPICLSPSPVTSTGTCQQLGANLANAQYVQPLAASGGVCTGQAVGDTTKVQTTQVRTCSVPTPDQNAVCAGVAPGGSAACIVAPGDVPCPVGPFQIRSVIADTETLVCSACDTCGVTASCMNPELDIYSDMMCNMLMTAIPANSTCINVQGGMMRAFWYKAQVGTPACNATGTSASFQATNAQTLCCQ